MSFPIYILDYICKKYRTLAISSADNLLLALLLNLSAAISFLESLSVSTTISSVGKTISISFTDESTNFRNSCGKNNNNKIIIAYFTK
jgi:hypothetical protein